MQCFLIKCISSFFLNLGCSVFTNATKAIDCRNGCRTESVYNYLGGGEGDNTGELGV
jgi:hypothetical protein